MSASDSHKKRFHGGCHCGAVRFEVKAPKDFSAVSCNCSICAMTGYLHLIVPASDFRLTKGDKQLITYSFNTGVAKHHFCGVCGIKSFYVPRSNPDGFSVNVRCLEGVEGRHAVESFDGQNWEANAASLKHLSDEDQG
ncbi:MAG: GFA family protein [Gammaproteobacteria bacterium]|nr:GFA family protein [Gammaproteobacteria bacterium]